jgi:hypothetical protein
MAMDAHVQITLEQRARETTLTDNNINDMLASECVILKERSMSNMLLLVHLQEMRIK